MKTGPSLVAFLKANAPFLAAGLLLSFTSSYGQTFFVSLFADRIMDEYGLTDGAWGGLYALATVSSAAAMIFAGSLTDRVRIRTLTLYVSMGLALACLGMAFAQSYLALILVVFALRFLGQGMMSHLPAVAMARWFVRSRGKALAISALGFSLGQAVLPVTFVSASEVVNWRVLWVIAAGLVLMTLPVIHRLLRQERTPQSIAKETPSPGLDGEHWTRIQLVKLPLFWAMIPLLLGPPAFGTALFFHQVHLVATKGWDLVDYVALLPVFTAVTVFAVLGTGALLDRVGSARLMTVYLLPYAAGFVLMGEAESLWGAAVALICFGLGSGAQGTLPTACWAELYGTRDLGSIKSLAVSIMVLGSAIGPGLTGYVIDWGWDFADQMLAIAIYFAAAQIIAAIALVRVLPRLATAP